MKLYELLKNELNSYNLFEKVFYASIICLIFIVSIILNDNKIALFSAICGITYTLFAGKGKVYCYYIGIIGTFCYCIISFSNHFYANFCLYFFYFLPMQILGIYEWKKHLNKKNEIIKRELKFKKTFLFCLLGLIFSLVLKTIFNNIFDSLSVGYSLIGQYFTLKRYIEQWYIWFFVDFTTLLMWIFAYIKGSSCFATILMWLIYTFLAIYFYIKWRKEINDNNP